MVRVHFLSIYRDHPRVCGEHASASGSAAGCAGSSPRVRGTRGGKDFRHREPGIIPACAGNTPRDCRPNRPPWDHPRVCGEHPSSGTRQSFKSGSSPRVRGTPCKFAPPMSASGIIPACAGNTPWRRARYPPRKDHPRVCGEHAGSGLKLESYTGSSPRVRGTPRGQHELLGLRGIIPACAGNTPRRIFGT